MDTIETYKVTALFRKLSVIECQKYLVLQLAKSRGYATTLPRNGVLAAFMYIIVIDDITTTNISINRSLNILWLSTKVMNMGLLALCITMHW